MLDIMARPGMRFISMMSGIHTGLRQLFNGESTTPFLPVTIGANKNMRALICKDFSLVTLFRIEGTDKMFDPYACQQAATDIASVLTSLMDKSGHSLQMSFHYDKQTAKRMVRDMMHPMINSAMNKGIDIKDVVYDWADSTSQYCAEERMYLALWTHPSILSKSDYKEELALMRKERRLHGYGNQQEQWNLPSLFIQHANFIASTCQALSQQQIIFSELTPEKAIMHIGYMFDPYSHDTAWKPRCYTEEKKEENKREETVRDEVKKDPFAPPFPAPSKFRYGGGIPTFDRQIVNRDITVDGDFLAVGPRLHRPFFVRLGPQDPKTFKPNFFNEVRKHPFSWRITFTLRGGANYNAIKTGLALFLRPFSYQNRQYINATEQVKALREAGSCIVGFQMQCDTWIDAPDTPENRFLLQKQASQLAGAVQAWGTMQIQNIVGDPYQAFISTIPGATWHSQANMTPAPLEDVLYLAPYYERPAAQWHTGVPFRTPDGKLMPYQPMSSRQASFLTVGVAPMGSGKSVFANTENFFFVFNPFLTDIPHLSIIDIGPSSKGFIKLVQSCLPEDKKHLALAAKLVNSEDYGINIFDTPLGVRYPLRIHMEFLINILTILATPVERERPYDGISNLARNCIEAVYRRTSEQQCKRYIKQKEDLVDKAVEKYNLPVDSKTTWWEITDMLYDLGETHIATLAQRHAVPTMTDFLQVASDQHIKEQFAEIRINTGETLGEFFRRQISQTIETYPILRTYTHFDIGEARVTSLDLDAFKGSGAESAKRMVVMFMVAEQILAGCYYEDPETDITGVPMRYRSYHEARMQRTRSMPKKLVFDEFHRIGKATSGFAAEFVGFLCTKARETRKWNVSYHIFTQFLADIPENILNIVTTVFIFGQGDTNSTHDFCKKFNLNETSEKAINIIAKPTRAGANLFALFRVDSSGKDADGTPRSEGLPYSGHILMSTIGTQIMWAFSTTMEDMTVREQLYRTLGAQRTLKCLQEMYPEGSIKSLAERRQLEYNRQGLTVNVLQEIVQEVIDYAKESKE